MSNLSAVEIAQRQRYVLLLEKVKQNKPLTSAELKELEQYERVMAKKKTSKKKLPKRAKKGKKVTARKKATKKKPAAEDNPKPKRLPISAARMKQLGYACKHLADADEAAKISTPLAELIEQHDHLAAAWERGQLLRNLEGYASGIASVTEVAHKLGFEKGQDLRRLLDTDVEVRDIWKQTRIDTSIVAKRSLLTACENGNTTAIRAVENLLRDESGTPKGVVRFDSVPMKQVADLFGVSRQAIHEWVTKQGLQRNADGTFDLATMIAWFSDYIGKKSAPTKGALSVADKYRMEKIEAEREKRRKARGELLERVPVVNRFRDILATIKDFLDRQVRDYPPILANKPPRHIEGILAKGRVECLNKLKTQPEEFQLSDESKAHLQAFYDSLCPVQQEVTDAESGE